MYKKTFWSSLYTNTRDHNKNKQKRKLFNVEVDCPLLLFPQRKLLHFYRAMKLIKYGLLLSPLPLHIVICNFRQRSKWKRARTRPCLNFSILPFREFASTFYNFPSSWNLRAKRTSKEKKLIYWWCFAQHFYSARAPVYFYVELRKSLSHET